MERKGIISELFKPAQKRFKRLPIKMKGINETLSIDLMDMQKDKRVNGGHRYILVAIDNFSKKAWCRPVKDKTAVTVTKAMESILEEVGKGVRKFHADEGKEFENFHFQRLLKKHGIKLYHTHSGMKSPIVERLIRTIRQKLEPELRFHGNRKWVPLLPEIINKYNNTYHRTIKMAPNQVTKKNEKKILKKIYNKKWKWRKPKFEVGDKVHISLVKGIFQKSTASENWSDEVFKIKQILLGDPITYHLQDLNDEDIIGRFYEKELQRAKWPHLRLYERILKKRGKKALVKFFNVKKAEWTDLKDIV